ncbi:MAG: hypothetical protein OYL92_06600 [Acidobacteriota bacterium]|nr:hypothetical protein [Acidobacteriota bacterium]MDE3264623.1 hypothetical protein [Acidobacteriota bacterium]
MKRRRCLPLAATLVLCSSAASAQQFAAESVPLNPRLVVESRVTADLNAAAKRTKRQKTGLRLMGIGSAAALAGYLEDSESRCKPGLEHSYLGYDCYADTAKELHYRGGNDDVIYGGAALAVLGLVIGSTGRKDGDAQAFSLSFRPVAGAPGLGRSGGIAVSARFRIGGRR